MKPSRRRRSRGQSRRLRAGRTPPPERRAELVRAVGDGIRARRLELAAWIVVETGKSWRGADADVCEAIDFCHYYAAEMLRLAQPVRLGKIPGETQPHVLQTAGSGGGDFAVELPAGDHVRHGDGGGSDREHRGAKARGAIQRGGGKVHGSHPGCRHPPGRGAVSARLRGERGGICS